MDCKKTLEAIWPIAGLRILGYLIYAVILFGLVYGVKADVYSITPFMLALSIISVIAIYGYGGYRAASKFGFSAPLASLISGSAGAVYSAIVGWNGEWLGYIVALLAEGIFGAVCGFLGASLAKMIKNRKPKP